jgi:hypothetical protein
MKNRKISGFSFYEIKEIYYSHPEMTLKELSKITGFSVDKLKLILLGF